MNDITQQHLSDTAQHSPSVFAAFGDAFRQMSDLLFRTFNLTQWLTLGLVCFLSDIGTAGSGAPVNFRFNRGSMRDAIGKATSISWETAAVIIAVAAVVAIVGLAILVVLAYIGCRFRFVYLEGVLRARFDIGAQWRANSARGRSLFLFYLSVGVIEMLLLLPAAVLLFLGLVFYVGAYLPYVLVLAVVVLLLVLAGGVVHTLLMDFVVPLMLFRDVTVLAAWHALFVLAGRHPLAFAVYVPVKWLLAFVSTILIMVAGCCTCCIGFMPVICQTITAPVHVTLRLFPVNLLWQMGEQYIPAEYPQARV